MGYNDQSNHSYQPYFPSLMVISIEEVHHINGLEVVAPIQLVPLEQFALIVMTLNYLH
jgi:hypothetical protein